VILAVTKPGKGVSIAEKFRRRPAEPLGRHSMEEALGELENMSEDYAEETEGGEPYEKYP
jgi:hypothetical protein